MQVFLLLITKLLALYFLIAIGFIAGRALNVQKESIARILIYILAPLVVLYGVWSAGVAWNVLSLPFLFLVVSIVLCPMARVAGKLLWRDATANLFAFTAATGNTGYFGIPVAMALLGEEAAALVAVAILGAGLFENTLGFYTVARGNFTVEQSIGRVLRLPTVYAFLVGVTLAASGYEPCSGIVELAGHVRGAFTVLGMMLVGLGLASLKTTRIDWKFIGATFIAKFFVWPAAMGLILWVDTTYLHFYTPLMHQVMFLLSIVPLAANTVALATELKAEPEKAATSVFFSTLFVLFYIPVMTMLFL